MSTDEKSVAQIERYRPLNGKWWGRHVEGANNAE